MGSKCLEDTKHSIQWTKWVLMPLIDMSWVVFCPLANGKVANAAGKMHIYILFARLVKEKRLPSVLSTIYVLSSWMHIYIYSHAYLETAVLLLWPSFFTTLYNTKAHHLKKKTIRFFFRQILHLRLGCQLCILASHDMNHGCHRRCAVEHFGDKV